MKTLTPRQVQVLRWIDENQITRARWLVNDRAPRNKEGPDLWNVFEMGGPNGTIRVKLEDHVALSDLKTINPTPDTMFGITDEARSLIMQSVLR